MGIPINCAVTINAIVLDGETKNITALITTLRISNTASIPPTLKTAIVGLTCSSRISANLPALFDFLSCAAFLLTL